MLPPSSETYSPASSLARAVASSSDGASQSVILSSNEPSFSITCLIANQSIGRKVVRGRRVVRGTLKDAGPCEPLMLRGVSRRQYRIALYNGHGDVIESAQYMHVSEETPKRGLPIDLPQGRWFVHEVAATWSDDKSSQLLGSDPHYGGTLICR